nr:uncharacterized mitochondrial protein AtMg00810-like [Tanacetum cinerariifolium]
MIAGGGLEWLFNLDALSKLMNYAPVFAVTNSNDFAASDSHNKDKHGPSQASKNNNQERPNAESSTKTVNTAGPVNTVTPTYQSPNDPLMSDLEDAGIFDDAYDDRDEGTTANNNNLETVIPVSPIPSTRIHKDHPKEHIIGEMEPKKATQALDDESWVEAIAFSYGTIEEEVYVRQPPVFVDPEFLDRVYKVEQRKDVIFLSQDKYISDILKKFGFSSVKSASTPMETHKSFSKDVAKTDVDVHLYRSMIGSLMYLSSSRPEIMYVVCACLRFQVQQKVSCMHAVKRIFRYLKGQPTLGLWYPKDSPLELIAYSDSDYAGASLDRKPTLGGLQKLVLLGSVSATVYIGLKLKGYLINDGYADLVQHANKKELAIPGQTTTGKELSNPLMAGSLLKTTLLTKLVKTVNDEVRIQALVDGKRVNIKESSIRRILRLEDADGTSCLPNAKIFKGLARMGAKTTSWNEFSSTMASAIICLAINQKFNFSRYILLSFVKNIEAGVPFFMFPRFVQMIINYQLGDMTHHKDIFATPSLTKKVFANMKRVGTGFSREVTPLFDNMFIQAPEEVAKIEKLESRVERLEEENRVLKELKSVHSTIDFNEPIMEKEKSSKQGRKIADIDADVEFNLEKAQAEAYILDSNHQEKVLSMLDVNDEEPADVEEMLEVVKAAKLITEVVTIAGVDVNAASV